jgi:hypothetical protein
MVLGEMGINQNQDGLSNYFQIWQDYTTLLVQHHGVVNSQILDLAFIAFWNQTLQIYYKRLFKFIRFFIFLLSFHYFSPDFIQI